MAVDLQRSAPAFELIQSNLNWMAIQEAVGRRAMDCWQKWKLVTTNNSVQISTSPRDEEFGIPELTNFISTKDIENQDFHFSFQNFGSGSQEVRWVWIMSHSRKKPELKLFCL